MESTSLLVNRLWAKPPLLFPIAGSAIKPIPFEIREPDFNKAIASVIWARHRQPTSTIFRCHVVNCPLCPAARAPDRPLVQQKMTSQLQQEKASKTDGPAVVNWLIPSSIPTSKQEADRKRPSSCTPSPPAKRFAPASSPCAPVDQRTDVVQARLKFQCPSCPMSFAKTTLLRVHRRIHTGSRPYSCQYCQKHFTDSSSLKKHHRVHTGEQPYRCKFEGCQRAFSQLSSRNRHQKVHLPGGRCERIAM